MAESGGARLGSTPPCTHPPPPGLPGAAFVPPRPPSRLLAFPPLSKSFHPRLLLQEEADRRSCRGICAALAAVGLRGAIGLHRAGLLDGGARWTLLGRLRGSPLCPGFPGGSEAGPARVSSSLSPCPSPFLSLQPQRPGVRLSPLLQKLSDFFLLIFYSLPLL